VGRAEHYGWNILPHEVEVKKKKKRKLLHQQTAFTEMGESISEGLNQGT
jgi:hypothetical protein